MARTKSARFALKRHHAVTWAAFAWVAAIGCADVQNLLGPKPKQLVFDVQPIDGLTDLALFQVVVSVRDARGLPDLGFSGTVTLSLPAGKLSGDTVARAISGTARFTNIRVVTAGSNYTLIATASDGKLGSRASARFRVSSPGQRIVFAGQGIFVANVDGSGMGAVVQDTSATWRSYGRPSWSPDATRIAFEKDSSIEVINADGSGVIQLAANGFDPAWSEDGARIRFARRMSGASTEIVEVSADGSVTTRLAVWPFAFHRDPYASSFDDTDPSDLGSRITWSPDGNRVVFKRFVPGVQVFGCDDYCGAFTRLAVMNADGTGLRLLTSGHDSLDLEWGAAWSPDGRRIAFAARPRWGGVSLGNPGLATIDVGTSGMRLTILGPDAVFPDVISGVAWSPDSRQIAILRDPLPNVSGSEIWITSADGTSGGRSLLRIVQMNVHPRDLAWSPR